MKKKKCIGIDRRNRNFNLTTSIRFLTLSIRFWNRNRFSIPNPTRKYKRAPAEYGILFAVFRSHLFEVRVRDQGRWVLWKVCASVPEVAVTWGHTWSTRHVSWSGACVFSARGRWTRSLWVSSNEKLYSRLSLFSRDEWQVFASHGSGPAVAEARRRHGSGGWDALFGLSDPADSTRVKQRLRKCVPLCLDSNTRGHVRLSRLSRRRAPWWVTVSRLHSRLFLFPRDAEQSVCALRPGSAVAAAQFLTSRSLLWSARPAHPL